MSKPDKLFKPLETSSVPTTAKHNLTSDDPSLYSSYHLLDYTPSTNPNLQSKLNDKYLNIKRAPLDASSSAPIDSYCPDSPKASEHQSILSEDANSVTNNSRRRRKDRRDEKNTSENVNLEIDYTSIEIKNEEGKANVQGKEEAKMIKKGNKMRSSMGQENFRMTGKVVKNNPGTETFSSRAKQNSRISEKNNTVKKRKRDEIMTPKTPNDHTFSKNWGKTINTEKHSRQQSVKK